MNLDPIKPYVGLVKLGLIVLFALALVGLSALGGWKAAAADSVETIAAKDKRIASLELSLGNFVTLFDRVNAQSEREIQFAADQAKAADAAAEAARRGEAAAQRAADDFEQQWAKARRKPDCAALLATDVEAVCGLSLR